MAVQPRAVGGRRLLTPAGGSRPAALAHHVLLIIQALVLGLVQGLTEFLPVSSSGHLQGVPYLLGWEPSTLTFDVMVHAGTLLAVVLYFRDDLVWIATRSLGRGAVDAAEVRRARSVVVLLAVGTVPAGVAGLAFEDVFARAFESPRAVSGFLYVTAGLLFGAEMLRRRRAAASLGKRTRDLVGDERHLDVGRREDTLRVRDVAFIGAAQALAIFPGVSRAGATMAAGMTLGLSRAAAARFSFLLSIPVILGATFSQLRELGEPVPGALPFGVLETLIGVTAAAASGYWAIRFLLRLVKTDDLLGFARYVVVAASLLLAGTFMIG